MINYQDLLKRYIRHVCECEGKSYVPKDSGGHSDVRFTPEEEAELDRLFDLSFPPPQGTGSRPPSMDTETSP